MSIDELEQLLEATTETQTLEFKRACDWDVRSFAKDILAMSNVRDGGHIVVGIADVSLSRQGITTTQKETYKQDEMRDHMSVYADPHVNFIVMFPKDRDGKEYVVIKVFQFDTQPVISRKDGPDNICAGRLYYRNRNRRPESAPVSNSTDMREIIDLAAVIMMKRYQELGFYMPSSDKQKLDEELQGL
jgi:predicted HTH transcriptional regulator